MIRVLMVLCIAGTYVPSTMDFPIINGDKAGGSVLGFGFTNPYDLPGGADI
jgi:hypothetical protein